MGAKLCTGTGKDKNDFVRGPNDKLSKYGTIMGSAV